MKKFVEWFVFAVICTTVSYLIAFVLLPPDMWAP